MASFEKVWGYRPNGESCLFAVAPGEKLPDGWSPDVMVIADPSKRTGEAVSAAAGDSVREPVPASAQAAALYIEERTLAEHGPADALRYDENNQMVEPPIARRRGRPPKVRDEQN